MPLLVPTMSWSVVFVFSMLFCSLLAQEINFIKEQVCYLPDIELVREDALSQLRVANVSGGVFDFASNSTCNGLAIRFEACVRVNLTDMGTIYRFLATSFSYEEDTFLYHQAETGTFTVDDPRPSSNHFCFEQEISVVREWYISEEDVFSASLFDSCNNNHVQCPADVVFEPANVAIEPTRTVEYQSQTTTVVRRNDLTTVPGFINARALVIPTPPPLPVSCEGVTPQLSCPTTDSGNIVIGEMESSPAPDRRFWGGGTYIMPQRVPVDGRLLSMSYTALLNTQGTSEFNFRFNFIIFYINEENKFSNIVPGRNMQILIDNGRPSGVPNSYSDALHSGSVVFPDNWEIFEGAQFAVFIPARCDETVCPANVNFMTSGDNCEHVLYRPASGTGVANNFRVDDSLNRRVPMKLNIQVTIAPANSNNSYPCTTVTISPTSTSDPMTSATSSVTSTAAPNLPSTTDAEEENSGPSTFVIRFSSIFGAAVVAVILLLVVFAVLFAVVFCRLRRQKSLIKTNDLRLQEVDPRDIVLSDNLQVEVNEKGRLRRRTIDPDEAKEITASGRSRAWTRVGLLRKSNKRVSSGIEPLLSCEEQHEYDYATVDSAAEKYADPAENCTATYSRKNVVNGELSPNYESPNYTDAVFTPADEERELTAQLASIGIDNIPEQQIELEAQIGKGQFGVVYKALWQFDITEENVESPQVNTISAHVAVKVMEGTPEERVKFLQEAVLVGQFNDPNIVSIFGMVIKPNKLMMICELLDEDLKAHLVNTLTRIQNGEMSDGEKGELPALLLSYCRKVASSFVYLGLKGFVHRDLAARNILVSSEGDCKIADFGMSREIQDDNDYYKSHGGLVPVKWTALEAIMFRKYSTKSDVWSYGILLYEIWSLGQKPYEGLNNQELIRKVQTGYRLPPPPGCPRSIYELLIKCTHPQPESRPTFTNILVSLQRPDYQLLKWADSDVLGRNLGDPLRDGEHLYTDLQNTYKGETAESNF